MPRPSSRALLLETAAEVVAEHGPTALTFDGVAAAAGLSKGGLLYHFPTKVALLEALLASVLDRFETEVDRRAAAADGPLAWARAYVDATFDEPSSQPDLAIAALLAAPEVSPELLARCVGRFATWQQRLEADGLPTPTAALVRYACDGWWTARALAPEAAADAEVVREQLHRQLDALVTAGAPA
jgi:AcrR family transcriptional regulator